MSTGFADEREVDVKFLHLLLLSVAMCIVCYLCGKADAIADRAATEKKLCATFDVLSTAKDADYTTYTGEIYLNTEEDVQRFMDYQRKRGYVIGARVGDTIRLTGRRLHNAAK